MRQAAIMLATVMLLTGLAVAAEETGAAALRSGPTVQADKDGVKIQFAVAGPTDVAVDITDAAGQKVLRHLGSAVLGGKNVPPPFAEGLSQSITWDRTDDAGRAVPADSGPFKARVHVGLTVGFDRFLGWDDPPTFSYCPVMGLAVGPDRLVYVIVADSVPPGVGRTENRIVAFTGEGKYVRTVYPFPATADPKKLRGAEFFAADNGLITPRIYDRVCVSYLPYMRAIGPQAMAATADGQLVFSSGWATELYAFGPRYVMVMNTDGTIPRERIYGPAMAEGKTAGYPALAVAPDGKTVYGCGYHEGQYAQGPAQQVVYTAGLGVEDKAEVFFGKKGQKLAGKDGLNDPRGLAVDGKGNVYVADFGNDRIVVLDSKAGWLGEIPLKGAAALAVHPKTGVVYALAAEEKGKCSLARFSGLADPKPTATVALDNQVGSPNPASVPKLALDSYGDKPILYVGCSTGYCRAGIYRVDDDGGKLDLKPLPGIGDHKGAAFVHPQGVTADDTFFCMELTRTVLHGEFVRSWMFDGASGKVSPWTTSHGLLRYLVGRDGQLYRANYYSGKAFSKVTRDDKVIPFSATGETCQPYIDEWRFHRDNMTARPNGQMWALHFLKRGSTNALISQLDPDGTMKREGVVSGLMGPSSVRVDSRGNIYVLDGLQPAGQFYPPEIGDFAKRSADAKSAAPRRPHSESIDDAYGETYGSVLKFGPDGGKVAHADQAEAGQTALAAYPGSADRHYVASGLTGIYPRVSPMSPPRDEKFSACWCLSAYFDLDGYDRLFVPDAMEFKVRVLDSNFNEICSFGGYDSATAKGGEANKPGPAIPFEFPMEVRVSDAAAYVHDAASCAHRVVRVKLGYKQESEAAIK